MQKTLKTQTLQTSLISTFQTFQGRSEN